MANDNNKSSAKLQESARRRKKAKRKEGSIKKSAVISSTLMNFMFHRHHRSSANAHSKTSTISFLFVAFFQPLHSTRQECRGEGKNGFRCRVKSEEEDNLFRR